MLSSVPELHGYIDKSQLTEDLGGTLDYCHDRWLRHRMVSLSRALWWVLGAALWWVPVLGCGSREYLANPPELLLCFETAFPKTCSH